MKKRLIGCGAVVLVIFGGLYYVGSGIYPSVKSAFESKEIFAEDLTRLDADHPFTPDDTSLDFRRFQLALEIRADLREAFEANMLELQAQEALLESEDLGFFDRVSSALDLIKIQFDVVGPTLQEISRSLRNAQMGPTEFAYYTRVLLAALARIDAGLGADDLEPLRGRYTRLKEEYPRIPALDDEQKGTLDELVGHVDSVILSQAEEVIAVEPELVLNGMTSVEYEFLYLGQLELDADKDAGTEETEASR